MSGTNPEVKMTFERLMEWGKTILVIAILPAVGWAWGIQGKVQTLSFKAALAEKQMVELKLQIKEAGNIERAVQGNTIALNKLGVELNATIKAFDTFQKFLKVRLSDPRSRGRASP